MAARGGSGLESGGMWQPERVRAREWRNVTAREDLSSRVAECGSPRGSELESGGMWQPGRMIETSREWRNVTAREDVDIIKSSDD